MESTAELNELRTEKTVYELFRWSVILKGVISLGEVVVGLALLAIPKDTIVVLVQGAGTWLSTHADSAIAGHVVTELTKFGSGTAVFVAIYLLSRGLIKCLLIYALLRNILWAYPASLTVLGLFVIYQIYEILTLGSVFVIAITLFDLVVMYFIWREWRIVLKRPAV
ncbi:MAG: hypothetical protein JWL75_609 [Parcubacteria group bacterium]|nr:hypothetical protein [Parcubacteria group bacterium]